MSSPRQLARAVVFAGAVLALAPPAIAEGLGELRVSSHIGEIFRAEIKVLGMRPSFSTDCIVLDPTQNDPESGLPRLRYASIALDAAGQRLLITSRDRISDPALHLSLTVTCGTHLTRDYVALLSPPPVGAATAAAVPETAPVARTPAPPPPRRASSAAPRTTGKPSVPKAAAMAPAVSSSAPAAAPSAAVPVQPPASERLELSPPVAELADIEREIAALNAELQRLSAGGGAQSAETQTRILEMETRLVRMELHAARARLQAPAGTPVATAATAGEAPPPPLQAPAVAPETKPANAEIKPEAPKAPRRVDSGSGNDGMWYGLGVLVLFGAGLGFYLMRRSSRREEAGRPEPAPVDGGRSVSSAEAKVRVRPAVPVAGSAPATADTLPPEPIPEFARDVAEPDELPPDAEVVKLAEVMSAFGRLDGAIEALRSFIREHPEGALRPSLFLLKLYRDQGNRQAFTELAAKLRGDPRFETIAWDMPAEALQRLIAAEG